MNGFTYEHQGTETMLVYELDIAEHVDSFAKGMLQENEMIGILRPSFTQRDMKQYLKFPVTSRIQLKEFLQGEMERETMLKLCLSIAGAVQEVEDYMMNPEKIYLDPDYIFVDIRKKEAQLLYLPVDEFAQDITVKEFLLYLLSHTRYQLAQDVSYVAKLIHFLNRQKAWEFDELQRYLQNLLNEKETAAGTAAFGKPQEAVEEPAANSGFYDHAQIPVGNFGSERLAEVSAPPIPSADIAPAADFGQGGFNPIAEDLDMPKKKGLFGKKDKKDKKEKKEKEIKAKKQDKKQVFAMPEISGIEVPGQIPSISGANIPQPEVILNVDEEGRYLAEQAKTEKKKKGGLFSFGKKKEQKKPEIPTPMGFSGALPISEGGQIPPVPAGGQNSSFPTGGQTPSFASRNQIPPVSPVGSNSRFVSGGQGQPVLTGGQVSPFASGGQSAREGATVYMGHGNSDDNNRTVIMGGGKDYGSTVILGAGGSQTAGTPHHVVKITRRRTGQSMVINKEVFRIGSEGSFVNFFIGDNPAIGSCHADIFEDGGFYYITDRNSVNHTYVDNVMAQPMQAVQLRNGCIIRLADEDFDFIIS